MWLDVHLICLYVGARTAFDVRAGRFAGSGLTDKISNLRSGLYGGNFISLTWTNNFHRMAFS
jgi:hypothetical protein